MTQEFGESLSNKFLRVADNDPNRCQATHAQYQCPFRAVGTYDPNTQEWKGPKYCPRHGGNKGIKAEEAASHKMYLAAKWASRIQNQAGHPQIKSLRSEIGIIRMMLEAKLQACQDEQELLMAASAISEMTTKLSDLIKSCHKIEKDTGQLLDRSQAQTWVNSLITIIAMYVPDPDVTQAMAEDMMQEFERLLNVNQNAS